VTAVWIVGEGGMLGSAVGRRLDSSARLGWTRLAKRSLPWADDGAFGEAVAERLAELRWLVESGGHDDWAIVWVAGAAVTSATSEQLEQELASLRSFCAALTDAFDPALRARGSVFYASSAGGIYGGSKSPPFTEETQPAPISPYGRFKLEAEAIVQALAASGCRVLIGRITNLYGPGQKLGKLQGLVSQLARAQLSPRPVTIYVPVETVRDYVYVDDCALLLLDAVERLRGCEPGSVVVKILGSGRGTSIAELLGQFRRVEKRRPNVMLGYSAGAALQGLDVRARSVVWTDLDSRDLTPLAAGIGATMDDVLLQLQQPRTIR